MTVFRVRPGDAISAESFNRLADATNPEVGNRAVARRGVLVPCSFKNTGQTAIPAGYAAFATWRDEEADAITARKRWLRDGFCFQGPVNEYTPIRQRRTPVTLLRHAAPGRIVPCYLQGIFASMVRQFDEESEPNEALYQGTERAPDFFAYNAAIMDDRRSYYTGYDVLAFSRVSAKTKGSSVRHYRFCLLRPRPIPPQYYKTHVASVDEDGTITDTEGLTFGIESYDAAVEEVRPHDSFYLFNGKPVSPVGLTRALEEIRSRLDAL